MGTIDSQATAATQVGVSNSYPGQGIALLATGQVLLSGGDSLPSVLTPTQSTALFNPDTNAITTGNALSKARSYMSPILLGDGRLLICGGKATAGLNNTCELYK